MNYPKVSFEIKPVVSLKTFSSRNALPGHAALAADEKPMVCVMPVGWGPVPRRPSSSRPKDGADWDDFEGAQKERRNRVLSFPTRCREGRIERFRPFAGG